MFQHYALSSCALTGAAPRGLAHPIMLRAQNRVWLLSHNTLVSCLVVCASLNVLIRLDQDTGFDEEKICAPRNPASERRNRGGPKE